MPITPSTVRSRRNHQREALERVERTLRAIADSTAPVAVVSAPETPFYVQFSRLENRVVGEAVGEANLPKPYAYRMGAHLRMALANLGWLPPEPDGSTGGNWHRVWPVDTWRENEVARLTIATFREAYDLLPWALVANAPSDAQER